MLKEFREFAVKGNVVDMAVGIIIGAAFTAIVKSLVDGVFMPLLGLVTGELDFSDHFLVLRAGDPGPPYTTVEGAQEAGAVVLAYGQLLNDLVSFLLVAWILFFIVRWMNRLRATDAPNVPNTKACSFCLSNIALKATRCPHCTSELAA